jgi:hypothetical protein
VNEDSIEYELIKQASALTHLTVADTKVEHFMDNTHVRITMTEDPEILETCTLGLIYALGVLSFHDARPRGVSGMHFQEKDDWFAADLLRHLTFPKGRIHFYADYVRGRMMKTGVDVYPDGRIVLDAVNRGEAPTRWVARIQGKKILSLVGGAPDTASE